MEQYGRIRQATNDNMAHALAYWITNATDTHSRNTCCLSMATSSTRMRLHVTFKSTFPVLPQYDFSLILSGVIHSLTILNSYFII